MPDRAAAHAVEVAGGDAVERHGDETDVVLAEHAQEELPEVVHIHLRVVQNGGGLFERTDQDIPELAVLGGQRLPSARLERLRALLQLPRQLQLLQIGGQRRGLFPRRPGGQRPFAQAEQGRGEGAPQAVDAPQLFLGGLVIGGAVALGVLPPVALSFPGGGAQLPFVDVIAQQVAVLAAQSGQARAHVADQIVHVPAALQDLIGEREQRGQRLLQQLAAAGGKEGDPVMPEDALERAAVVLKAAHSDGDVPPAAALVPHQLQHARCRGLALGGDALGGGEADRGLFPLPALARPGEHVLAEKAQGVGFGSAAQALRPRRHAQFPRRVQQAAAGDAREREDLAALLEIVHGHADRELHALSEQRAQHLLLLPREIDEAVHIDVILRPEIGVRELLGQHRQAVGGVGPAARGDRVKGALDQRQIAQLCA